MTRAEMLTLLFLSKIDTKHLETLEEYAKQFEFIRKQFEDVLEIIDYSDLNL